MSLNIADLFEHVVDVVPDRLALIAGDSRRTHAELEARANRAAHHLQAAGIQRGEHVGLMARNVADHVAAMLGCFKAGVVGININYRYVEGELDYLVENSGMVALVHEAQYSRLLDAVVPRHESIRDVVVIDDGSGLWPTGYSATSWANAIGERSPERDFAERSADDIYIVYTGGTTGYPKGVMWRHEDVWRTLGGGIDFATGLPITEYQAAEAAAADSHPLVCLQLGPIMHANGQWGMLLRLFTGHTNVLLPAFDPATIWRTVETEGVRTISVIGDAMARPLIEEYESGTYRVAGLISVNSSSAVFSRDVKNRWLAAFPNAMITDIIGSSETGFTGNGLVTRDVLDRGTLVKIGPQTAVLADDDRLLDPDTDIGRVGRMVRSGHIPLGYFRDEEKTARTFITLDGVRYAVPGDYVRIEPERRLTLLGRGSGCINTGGEKVYPEEVENALKSHPDVFDALVLGVAHPTWGQQVAAVVQPREGHRLDADEVRGTLRAWLSGYKIPRVLRVVEAIPRHVTGKADYTRAKELLAQPKADSQVGVA